MNWQANWRLPLFSSLTFPRQIRGGDSGSSDSFAEGKSDYSEKLECIYVKNFGPNYLLRFQAPAEICSTDRNVLMFLKIMNKMQILLHF